MYGAIELGGTKILCAVSNEQNEWLARTRIETKFPRENLVEVIEFFRDAENRLDSLRSLGIACFGPLILDSSSADFGQIQQTAKPGWSGFQLHKEISRSLQKPVNITTDVNGALLAEQALGAARGATNCIYITIGTGVGAGIMVNGQLVTGFLHPEVGHMRVPTAIDNGSCPFHGNCVEGLVSGPAIARRAGCPAEELSPDSPIWDEVAVNIADMCINLVMTLAPEKIVLGGGVMKHSSLLGKVQHHFRERIGGYLDIQNLAGGTEQLIMPPQCGHDSGLVGALLLAQRAHLSNDLTTH